MSHEISISKVEPSKIKPLQRRYDFVSILDGACRLVHPSPSQVKWTVVRESLTKAFTI